MLLRLEHKSEWPKFVKLEQKAHGITNFRDLKADITIERPQNLYSAEICTAEYNKKMGISDKVPTIKHALDYKFRFTAVYDTSFEFLGQSYTFTHKYTDLGDEVLNHIKSKFFLISHFCGTEDLI